MGVASPGTQEIRKSPGRTKGSRKPLEAETQFSWFASELLMSIHYVHFGFWGVS